MFNTNKRLSVILVSIFTCVIILILLYVIPTNQLQDNSTNQLIYKIDGELDSVDDYLSYNFDSKEDMISFLEDAFDRESLAATEYRTNLNEKEQNLISESFFEQVEKNTDEILYFPKNVIESVNILKMYKKDDNYALLISVNFKANSISSSYQKITFIREEGSFIFQDSFLLYGGI